MSIAAVLQALLLPSVRVALHQQNYITPVIAFPNCKINLGLQVLQKRDDGFHHLDTVFYPVPLKDVLELIPAPEMHQPVLSMYGLPVKGDPTDNLCHKAWQLLNKDFPELPAVHMHLLKNIAMGAGLGGGSSNGAFMLQLLNNKYHLQLTEQQLLQYALQLGSDCPFFIINKPCAATGRGEVLEPVTVNLSGWQLVFIHPGIHVQTRWAFGRLPAYNPLSKKASCKEIVRQPVATWKTQLVNDFEKTVFAEFPAIKAAKEQLYQLGAVYASMSGSGSTVFGLFNTNKNLTGGWPTHCTVIQL